MTFRIVVTELFPHPLSGEAPEEIERFRQCVDQVDLAKLFQAINTPPPSAPAQTEGGRAMKKLYGWFLCFNGLHDWTCAAAEGVKPTQAQLDAGLDGLLDYATMYCRRCGRFSDLSKRRSA
jgi:hypothetical protein